MIEIEKKYYLTELIIKVNKRELFYDFDADRAIYTYNGINKEEFEINHSRKYKVLDRYKLWNDYSFCKYEEIRND